MIQSSVILTLLTSACAAAVPRSSRASDHVGNSGRSHSAQIIPDVRRLLIDDLHQDRATIGSDATSNPPDGIAKQVLCHLQSVRQEGATIAPAPADCR